MKSFFQRITCKYPELYKFFKFGLVGGVNTLVDFIIFSLLTQIPFFYATVWLTNIISYSCGILNSFYLNRKFTFSSNVKLHSKRGILFVLVNFLTFGIGTAVIYYSKNHLGLGEIVSKAISLPFTIIINFILTRLFVFNKQDETSEKK